MKIEDDLFGLGRPTVYYTPLNRITGDTNSTIFLTYISFWMGLGEDKIEKWVYKTIDQIKEETGLSRYEQESARRNLRMLGFIEEKKAGVPARLYFRSIRENYIKAWREVGPDDNDPFTVADKILKEYKGVIKETAARAMARALMISDNSLNPIIVEYVDYPYLLGSRGAKCEICGDVIYRGPGNTRGSLIFDHIVPLHEGGAHIEDNIRVVHAECSASENLQKRQLQDARN